MYNTICNFEHLLNSYQMARRDNRYKRQVCQFGLFLEDKLLKLRWDLLTNNYCPYPYTYFVITDPKLRHVAAPNFRDRVLQHALVSIIEPILDKTFIYDSFACRKGKGTHFALKRAKKFLAAARSVHGSKTPLFVLQCDISKFFSSVSWDVLIDLINKKVADLKIQKLIADIITTHKVFSRQGEFIELPKEVITPSERKGLPIGNLTSQLFANVYLNELDHFVKETIKERWYGRYMDDFFIIHPDNKYLEELREKIRAFLWDNLRLALHPRKSVIQNLKNGLPFVGYLIFYDHVLIRGSTLLRMQRKFKKRQRQTQKDPVSQKLLNLTRNSYQGHLKYADTYNLKSCFFAQDLPYLG